jgi:hypothetical protein
VRQRETQGLAGTCQGHPCSVRAVLRRRFCTVPLREQCEWCSARAQVLIRAQWSVFDFDDAQACCQHQVDAIRYFQARCIDGQPPAEVVVGELDC